MRKIPRRGTVPLDATAGNAEGVITEGRASRERLEGCRIAMVVPAWYTLFSRWMGWPTRRENLRLSGLDPVHEDVLRAREGGLAGAVASGRRADKPEDASRGLDV